MPEGWEPTRETVPVGVPDPEVTWMVTLTGCPWVMGVEIGANVVVVEEKLTKFQLLTRFAVFTEPSPLARSYPALVVQAGEEVLLGFTRIPVWPDVALQFGVPPLHATELLPVTVS